MSNLLFFIAFPQMFNNVLGDDGGDDCTQYTDKDSCKKATNCGWSTATEGCTVSCLSENDLVLTSAGETKLLKDIIIGDQIFDGESFTKVLSVEYGGKQEMLKLFMTNINDETKQTTVTMTANHLLYDENNELIRADEIKMGSVIYDDFIVNKIEIDEQYSATPFTFSGYLQVNGIKVSSYVESKKHAKWAHNFFGVFRWLSDNINEQITGKVVEWLATDHHYYRHQLKSTFGDQFILWYLLSPFVAVSIIAIRLWVPILICFSTTLFVYFVVRGKQTKLSSK